MALVSNLAKYGKDKVKSLIYGNNSQGTSSTTSAQDRYNELLNQRQDFLNNTSNQPSSGATGNNVYVSSYNQPDAMRDYSWDDGSAYLQPDNPLVRPVVYNNEFSPDSTMSMATDIYNEYYAPMVQEQQRQTTQAYRDTAAESAATAGAAGMATGSRGAIQLQNQANREATAANLQYQQQMQLQAFQDTLNARNLELQNKELDYQNAWQEVAQYGYVVTEQTGNLLGIQPGQQLTTYTYKKAMSDIATNVANINAQKVELNQQQQQLDQQWASFQESIRQYEKNFAEEQRQFGLNYELDKLNTTSQYNSNIYSVLTDMLQRYDTITPQMSQLGAQVGMYLPVGEATSNYLTEAERAANNQYAATNQSYYNNYQQQQLANSYVQDIQNTGKIGNASQFASVLAQWKTQGVSAEQAVNYIKNKNDYSVASGTDSNGNVTNTTLKDILGNVKGVDSAAIDLVYKILGNSNTNYSSGFMSNNWASPAMNSANYYNYMKKYNSLDEYYLNPFGYY